MKETINKTDTSARDCASFPLEKAFCDWTCSQFAPSPQ